jgi:hypothetical protein
MPSDEKDLKEVPWYDSYMMMQNGFIDTLRSYGGCEVYAAKFEKWDKIKLLTQYVDVAEPMKCGFVIMNHGDLWLNNMMFKADADNKSIDCKLIDFQMPFWASPAADLQYFLISSVENDIKVEHFDDFIEFYHTELSSGLKKLGYDQYIPTLVELHVDLLEKRYFGMFDASVFICSNLKSNLIPACMVLMIILFIVKYDSPEDIDMDVFMAKGENPDLIDRIYGNECYKTALKLWLPFFDKRKFIDVEINDENTEE